MFFRKNDFEKYHGEKSGIMTWVDKDILELVSADIDDQPYKKPNLKYY